MTARTHLSESIKVRPTASAFRALAVMSQGDAHDRDG
jgi:hypothetical protein